MPPAVGCQEKGLGTPPFLLYFNFRPKRECLVDILVLLQSLQTPRTLAHSGACDGPPSLEDGIKKVSTMWILLARWFDAV